MQQPHTWLTALALTTTLALGGCANNQQLGTGVGPWPAASSVMPCWVAPSAPWAARQPAL